MTSAASIDTVAERTGYKFELGDCRSCLSQLPSIGINRVPLVKNVTYMRGASYARFTHSRDTMNMRMVG
jgi:hypothetical protein